MVDTVKQKIMSQFFYFLVGGYPADGTKNKFNQPFLVMLDNFNVFLYIMDLVIEENIIPAYCHCVITGYFLL